MSRLPHWLDSFPSLRDEDYRGLADHPQTLLLRRPSEAATVTIRSATEVSFSARDLSHVELELAGYIGAAGQASGQACVAPRDKVRRGRGRG